jgi:general secretion pathway protein E
MFPLLLIIDAVSTSLATRRNVFDVLGDKIHDIIQSVAAMASGIAKPDNSITLLDSSGRSITEIYGHGRGRTQDNHILDLTESVIRDALDENASDILIDPRDNSTYTVRFRVDGVLRTVQEFDSDTCAAIINSIKAVSNMDIAEKRRPQDGAFVARTKEGTSSFRVASAGVLNGEKLSIRVLNQSANNYSLGNIGLTEKQQAIIKSMIEKPSGMILTCGPTGSGKTTTLYGMLSAMDLLTRNVITIEDPIEYVLPNASQIEVNAKADITFAKTLRSVLRQDPDIICVGEIRDEETASIALRAAQTGHLVLATLHSNSNAGTLVRLLDLGVPPVLMSAGLNAVISQRLLRRLCRHCKAPAELTALQMQEFRKMKLNYRNICQPIGCEECFGTGYRGRTAIFDILLMTPELKHSIATNDLLLDQLRKGGDRKGTSNLYKQGLKQVVSGITSLDELKRVIG